MSFFQPCMICWIRRLNHENIVALSMIGLVTGGGGEGKSNCKVGTRWVRQSYDGAHPPYTSDIYQLFGVNMDMSAPTLCAWICFTTFCRPWLWCKKAAVELIEIDFVGRACARTPAEDKVILIQLRLLTHCTLPGCTSSPCTTHTRRNVYQLEEHTTYKASLYRKVKT